jgi:hypothetical protein
MAGYCGYSKSNNAIQAEHLGRFPASVLAKKLSISTEAIKALMQPCEWHHTSSRYNRTDYYDLEEAQEMLVELKAYKKPNAAPVNYTANVKYLEWSGSRKYPKATEYRFDNIKVTEKGQFYTFHTPHGDVRKKIGSNGTEVTKC